MSDIVDKAKGQANLLVSAYHKPMRVLDCQGMSAFMKAPSDFPPDNPMNTQESNAMKHPDTLGAGAKKRKHLKGQEKVHVVMGEFKRGTLHSGSGAKVKNRKQAVAIAMSEAGKSKK